MGATALIKSLAPYLDATDCSRGLMQLCFSMVPSVLCSLQLRSAEPSVLIPLAASQFVPTHVSAIALPDTYFDMITAAEELTQPADRPAAQLLVAATRFVQLAAFVRGHVLSDGKPRTANTLRELLLIDAELVAWEAERERVSSTSASSPISFTTTTTTTTMAGHPEDAGATGQDYARPQDIWTFAVECDDPADPFPAAAVFRGRFHAYSSMWTARVWNHYRWVRLSTAQMLLEAADRFPQSAAAAGIGAPAVRAALTAAVQRMAAATLASLPTHWRHPALRPAQRARINRKSSGAGIGAAGVPTLLFQIKSAACAPGTPHAHWAWALDVLDTIWRDTGMLQARALAGVVRAHGEAVYPIYHPDAYLPPAHGTTRAGHVLGVGGVDASAMKFELM